MDKKIILIFGVGELQKSIINRAKQMGLFVIGIDPCEDAVCKDEVDAFEVVGGQDFEGTLEVAEKYHINAIITAATDKPLVMMARIAERLHLPFFSVDTAVWSTDKYQMKQRFIEGDVPCAKGILIHTIDEADNLKYPVICKPRDNSGSRGVKLCSNREELQESIQESIQFSKKDSVLVEELIEGQEYSIESLHFDGKSQVIQFTEKTTTPLPYNVELCHKQPANLTEEQKSQIRSVINKIAKCMNFENCSSHTELKINDRGIFVIETSPRLGGDFITSDLVPLSSGINMEDLMINISLGEDVSIKNDSLQKASGVCFLSLPEGKIVSIDKKIQSVTAWEGVKDFTLKLKEGDNVNQITSSLNRYGYFIVQANNRKELDYFINTFNKNICKLLVVE